tara:strand:+ start:31 stop:411 length:381 start_codon:yes stop_codon:yes gene_type:complete
MGQRVNVQYSVDLEELPVEVENLLSKAERKLAGCLKDLQALIKSYNHQLLMTTACTQDMGAIREELANVDFVLNDAGNIINGFVSYQLQDKSEPLPPEEALKDNPYIDGEQIAQKIKEFKESLNPQ